MFFSGGKFDKTFGDDQCANIGIEKYKDVAKCTNACKKKDQCTAVNYCSDNDECSFRKCGSPLPKPTGRSTGGCDGYASAGTEHVKKEKQAVAELGQAQLKIDLIFVWFSVDLVW